MMHYYDFHIGDYRSATSHLSNEEDLAYRRLLDMYYDTERPIPLDIQWVSRRLRLGSEIVQTVLNDMFEHTDDGYKNNRADQEIQAYHSFRLKQKTNGKKGGRPKKTKAKPTDNPTVTQHEPKKSLTSNQEPVTNNKNNTSAEADFDRFWEVWPSTPRKVAKQKCLVIWKQKKLSQKTDQIIAHVKSLKSTKQWTDGFEPSPLTYLNQGRYDDGIPDAANETKAMGVKIL